MVIPLIEDKDVMTGRPRSKDVKSATNGYMDKEVIIDNTKMICIDKRITMSDAKHGLFTVGPFREHLPNPGIGKNNAINMILVDMDSGREFRPIIYYPQAGSNDIQIRNELEPFFSKYITDVSDLKSLSYEQWEKYISGDIVRFFIDQNNNTRAFIKYIRSNNWDDKIKYAKDGFERARITADMFLNHLRMKYNVNHKKSGTSACILDNGNVLAFMYFSSEISNVNIGEKKTFDSYPIEKIWYIFCVHEDIQKRCNKFIIMNGANLKEKLKIVGSPGSKEFSDFVPSLDWSGDTVKWNNPEIGVNNDDLSIYLNRCELLIKGYNNIDIADKDDVPDEFFKDARPVYRDLIKEILKDHPSTMKEIYEYISKLRSDLCPDNIRCSHVSSCKADEPRWKHQVRYAKYDLSSIDSPHYVGIVEINGIWQFPDSINNSNKQLVKETEKSDTMKHVQIGTVEMIDPIKTIPSKIIDNQTISKKCKELTFQEKILIKSDIPEENDWGTARLYSLGNIQNIPGPNEEITVVDCETGNKYPTHIHSQGGLIAAGLIELWNYDDRKKKFHIGDAIGVALDPVDNHMLYVCFKYQKMKDGRDTKVAQQASGTGAQQASGTGAQQASETSAHIDKFVDQEITDTDPDKQPVTRTSTYIDKFVDQEITDTDPDKQPVTRTSAYIDKFIDLEIPDTIPNEEKEEIRSLINKDRHKIESIVNESLRPVINSYHSKIVSDKERKEYEVAKIKLEEDEKIRDQQRKKDIEKKRENLYNTEIGMLITDAKNCNLYGPSGTSKTTLAMKTAGEIVGTCIDGETKNLYKEFKDKGYIIFVRIHPSYDYGRFIERKTFHTEKEGEPTVDKKFISLPGDLKIASKRALLLATGGNIGDKDNWNDVYKRYMLLTEKQRKDIFDYAPAVVLIIDELNRGNIQEILGEVGTMMEKDKRLGEDNEVTIILKSGDIFGIPPNLYIISTMNTVDSSIVGIDIATMRRFNSMRCLPDFRIVKDYIDSARKDELVDNCLLEKIDDIKNALEKINSRIRNDSNLGLYRQIGHTYLLDISSNSKLVDTEHKLMMAWNNRIFPAIEIICRYDYDKIVDILFNDDSTDRNLQQLDTIDKLDDIIKSINRSD